jgi:hypothetical protein
VAFLLTEKAVGLDVADAVRKYDLLAQLVVGLEDGRLSGLVQEPVQGQRVADGEVVGLEEVISVLVRHAREERALVEEAAALDELVALLPLQQHVLGDASQGHVVQLDLRRPLRADGLPRREGLLLGDAQDQVFDLAHLDVRLEQRVEEREVIVVAHHAADVLLLDARRRPLQKSVLQVRLVLRRVRQVVDEPRDLRYLYSGLLEILPCYDLEFSGLNRFLPP